VRSPATAAPAIATGVALSVVTASAAVAATELIPGASVSKVNVTELDA